MDNLILDEIVAVGNRVQYRFSYSKGIERLFTTNEMFIEYDFDVSSLPRSILTIPFVGSFIALTWLTNTVLWVTEIDETFYQSLKSLKVAYQELYPHYKFGGRFVSARIEGNDYDREGNKDLLLFSGGVDAITSYLRNVKNELLLTNIQGWFDNLTSRDAVADKEFKLVDEFAKSNNRQTVKIKSNFAKIVDNKAFQSIKRKVGDSWWHGFSHSMSFISISIPVAISKRCGNIIIASSFTIGDSRVCASYATTDIEFKFCKYGRTIHDGFELSRQDKIRKIVEYQTAIQRPFPLKVCSFKEENCTYCEKCFRTISALIAEGANPNDFGFVIRDNIKNHFSSYFDNNLHLFGVRNEYISHWPHIKKRMQANMPNVLYKDFAEWFLTYDFVGARKKALIKYYRTNLIKILRRKIREL